MGRSTDKETRLGKQRKYRSWTAQQNIEIMLASLRSDRSVMEVCREHEISDTLYYSWRDKLLEGGREALAGKEERTRRSCDPAPAPARGSAGRSSRSPEALLDRAGCETPTPDGRSGPVKLRAA
jgi:transposase-like protein